MIVAHPDDESIFGGHVLNADWKVICVTNANNIKRATEFKNVMNKTGSLCEMWDFTDHKHYNFGGRETRLLYKLKTEFGANNYEMIVTHNLTGDYGHLQHKLLSEIVTKIANKNILYYFNLTNDGLIVAKNIKQHTKNIYHINTTINLTVEEINYKNQLLTFYESQKHVIK